MGRPRSFDVDEVVTGARHAFAETGYTGTSVDDLLQRVGIVRASLYQAFGSKRGLFVTALQRTLQHDAPTPTDLDLLLVALMDLAPRDAEVRSIASDAIDRLTLSSADLGRRLLERAAMDPPADAGAPKEGTPA